MFRSIRYVLAIGAIIGMCQSAYSQEPQVPMEPFLPVQQAPKMPVPTLPVQEPKPQSQPPAAVAQDSQPEQEKKQGAGAGAGQARVVPNTGMSRSVRQAPAKPKEASRTQTSETESPIQELKEKLPLLHGIDRPIPPEGKALPILGQMPGAKKPIQPMTIRVMDGQQYVVRVSCCMPNRIATPFYEAEVVDSSGANIVTRKGDVYVVPASDEPFVIYISDAQVPRSSVVALTLVPERIPGQTVLVQFDDAPSQVNPEDEINTQSDDYTDWVRNIYRAILRGHTPQGFTSHAMKGVVAKAEGLTITPKRRYSGQMVDMYVYEIQNESDEAIELNEASFYQPGVRAVAFYPTILLEPKKTTRVYILSQKPSASAQGVN